MPCDDKGAPIKFVQTSLKPKVEKYNKTMAKRKRQKKIITRITQNIED